MSENTLKNLEVADLRRELRVLKNTSGNFRCRYCRMVDGYSEEEKKCRWCGQEIYQMDRL